jgi:hypothetical protein
MIWSHASRLASHSSLVKLVLRGHESADHALALFGEHRWQGILAPKRGSLNEKSLKIPSVSAYADSLYQRFRDSGCDLL